MKAALISSVLVVLLLSSSFLILLSPAKTASAAPIYMYSEFSNLWVRKNGSDPGFPFPYANQPASLGMNYFGTNNVLITWDQTLSDANNSAKFPIGCHEWIQTSMDSTYAAAIANAAKTNSRISGAFVDDFRVGKESPANMTALYSSLHHEDANLTQGALSLYLVVYQYNYNVQMPYTWSSIMNKFDGISFWFYPTSYPNLYPDFVGYDDALRGMHAIAPTKDFWAGIYLHFYNVGYYPADFTSAQLNVVGRLFKDGIVSKLSILENFWIRNNPSTAALVQGFIVDELNKFYATSLNAGSGQITSTSRGLSCDAMISGMHTVLNANRTLYSSHLQNITVWNLSWASFAAQNIRTGVFSAITDINASAHRFIAEAGESYRLLDLPLSNLAYTSTKYLTSDTIWANKRVYLNCTTYLATNLTIENSIIEWGNTGVHSWTSSPAYGLNFNNTGRLFVKNSTIQPVDRNYGYYINGNWPITGTKRFVFTNSTVVGMSGRLIPVNYLYVNDTTFFATQPNGETNYGTIWILAPSTMNVITFNRNLIWNYYVSGLTDFFIQPSNLQTMGNLQLKDNEFAGGATGIWVDMSFGDDMTFRNPYIRSTSETDPLYLAYKLDSSASNKALSLEFMSGNDSYPSLRMYAGSQIYGQFRNYSNDSSLRLEWTVIVNGANKANCTIIGIPGDTVYEVDANGTLKHSQKGGNYGFNTAGGSYVLKVFVPPRFPTEVRPYIDLIIIFFGLMVGLTIFGFAAASLERGVKIRESIDMILFVVIALILFGILIVFVGW